MAKRVFFSFHYKPDNWRASQVRNMGVIEGNPACKDNDWETITRGGDDKIKAWIAEQMDGKSCVVVLIGANTAGRKWISHEIVKGWNDGKGVLGIHVHNLKDCDEKQTTKGANPFERITLGESGKTLASIVKAYDPPYSISTNAYEYIKKNLADWVDESIAIRGRT